jgi:hypothetical protein
MRLDDVLGPDALYLGLFRLAAGRIQGFVPAKDICPEFLCETCTD